MHFPNPSLLATRDKAIQLRVLALVAFASSCGVAFWLSGFDSSSGVVARVDAVAITGCAALVTLMFLKIISIVKPLRLKMVRMEIAGVLSGEGVTP